MLIQPDRPVSSENLPHKSGITTLIELVNFESVFVGKLAPQIGDYDQVIFSDDVCQLSSENLPHKSGITTYLAL